MTAKRVRSSLVSGLYSKRGRIEQEVRGLVPELIRQLESAGDQCHVLSIKEMNEKLETSSKKEEPQWPHGSREGREPNKNLNFAGAHHRMFVHCFNGRDSLCDMKVISKGASNAIIQCAMGSVMF